MNNTKRQFSLPKFLRNATLAALTWGSVSVATPAFSQVAGTVVGAPVSANRIVRGSDGTIIVQSGASAGSFVRFNAGGVILQSQVYNDFGPFIPGVVGATLQVDPNNGQKNITIVVTPGTVTDADKDKIAQEVVSKLRDLNIGAKQTLSANGITPQASSGPSDLHVTFAPAPPPPRVAATAPAPQAVQAPAPKAAATPVQTTEPCPWHVTHSNHKTYAWLTQGLHGHHFNNFIIGKKASTAEIRIKLPSGLLTANIKVSGDHNLSVHIFNVQTTATDKAKAQKELGNWMKKRGLREFVENRSQISSDDCRVHVNGTVPPATIIIDQPAPPPAAAAQPNCPDQAVVDGLKAANQNLQGQLNAEKTKVSTDEQTIGKLQHENNNLKHLLEGLGVLGLIGAAYAFLRRRFTTGGGDQTPPDGDGEPKSKWRSNISDLLSRARNWRPFSKNNPGPQVKPSVEPRVETPDDHNADDLARVREAFRIPPAVIPLPDQSQTSPESATNGRPFLVRGPQIEAGKEGTGEAARDPAQPTGGAPHLTLVSNHSISETLEERFKAAKKLVTEYRKGNATQADVKANLEEVARVLPAAFEENAALAFKAARYYFNIHEKEFGTKEYAILHKIAENFDAISKADEVLGKQSANFVLRHATGVLGQELRRTARSYRNNTPQAQVLTA